MNWFTGIVLYTLIWWTALFAVLPLGTQPESEPDPATGWRGAPASARMGRKFVITTIVATLIFAAAYLVITSGWISFRSGLLALPD